MRSIKQIQDSIKKSNEKWEKNKPSRKYKYNPIYQNTKRFFNTPKDK